MEVIDRKKKSSVSDYDFEQKEAIKNLNKDLDSFIQEKKTMSPLAKWEAFDDICEEYSFLFNRIKILAMTNGKIRKLQEDE